MRNVYDSSYLRIYHDGYAHTLELEWLGLTAPAELHAGLLEGLRWAELYQVRAWIANLQSMHMQESIDDPWIQEVWFPQFFRLNITHMAIVQTKAAKSQQEVMDIMHRANGMVSLCTRYFDTVEAARTWVHEGHLVPTESPFIPKKVL